MQLAKTLGLSSLIPDASLLLGLVDARTHDCYGRATSATLTAAIDWICRFDPRRVAGRSVMNVSSAIIDQSGDATALQQQIAVAADTYNIPLAAAVGNDNSSAFWYVPANAQRAIAVGGLQGRNQGDTDTRWCCYQQCGWEGPNRVCRTKGSNYGYLTTFYAPSQRVEAASTMTPRYFGIPRANYRSELTGCSNYADTCTSGTSFAAPHLTGVIARYLQRYPGTSQ